MSKELKMRFCAHDIVVKINDPGAWDYSGMGRAMEMTGEILVRSGMPASMQCSTLVHEILHMILGINGLEKENGDERLICVLSAGLLDVLRNNPEIGRALINCESIEKLAEDSGDDE